MYQSRKYFQPDDSFVIYTSGGGMHNPLLIQNISSQLPGIEIKTTSDLEINPDAKEAVLFAILANECLCGDNSTFKNIATGIASISMGKISFPD